MAKTFNLGDKVTHDFSGGVGTVLGLRKAEPYTVKVGWEGSLKKDWYKPEVLLPHIEVANQFYVDKDNNDDEHFYVDIAGKGTVCIISNQDGVSVDIFPLHVADEPLASMYVLNDDFTEEEDGPNS